MLLITEKGSCPLLKLLFHIPHAGRSDGLGDQADHGCRGNQNRIADPPAARKGEQDDPDRGRQL